jgi:drug/metabolite transporter (DMT)-like permease
MNFEFLHSGEIFSTLSALAWAFAVILYRKSGEQISPFALNLFKNTLVIVLFGSTMVLLGVPFFPADQTVSDWVYLLVSGAIGIGIADSVFFASLNRLGAGRSAIVDCLYSPFVILCSFVFLSEPVGLSLLVGVSLIIAGIMVGTWKPAHIDSPTELRQIRVGILLGIVAMLLMAVGIVMAKPVITDSNPWWASSVRVIGGLALLGIQAVIRSDKKEIVRTFTPGPLWKVTVPATLVGSFVANFFWIVGMKYTYATIASVLNQLSCLFVLVFATAFLGEPLTGRKSIAIVLGFAGGMVAVL